MARTSSKRVSTIDAGSIDLDGRPHPVTVRIDRRAKRLIMRIDNCGCIRLTCPHEKDVGAALAMAKSRRDWIGSRLAEMAPPTPFTAGETIPVLGRDRLIVLDPAQRSPAILEPQVIRVGGGNADLVPGRVTRLLRREVQTLCRKRALSASARLGVTIGRIRVREMKTRWGSCSARGDITFNWRLAHAPVDVLDYVVCHEVAHRQHMDHSPAFWKVVEFLYPGYGAQERWLRDEGRTLFSYGTEPVLANAD